MCIACESNCRCDCLTKEWDEEDMNDPNTVNICLSCNHKLWIVENNE